MKKTVCFSDTELYRDTLPHTKKWDFDTYGLKDERFCGYENLYVGVVRIEGYDLLFTQIVSRSDSIYQIEDEIQLYEVAANTAPNYSEEGPATTIFYNTENIYDLNNSRVWLKINSTKGHELRRKGLRLPDILTMLDIEFEESPLEETIEAEFERQGCFFGDIRDELEVYGLSQRYFERCSSFQGKGKVKRDKKRHPNTVRVHNRL